MHKVIVFAPKSDVDTLVTAMGDAGAGTIGKYSHCAFVTQGVGHWKSLPGSHPTVGKVGEMSTEEQHKIEMVCTQEALASVVSTIRKTHSYETPEINIVELVDN
jgi:hypothetical protein